LSAGGYTLLDQGYDMLELPVSEIIVFLSVVFVYLCASVIGVLQLLAGGDKYKHSLAPLVSLAVVLEAVLLILRAVELKAIPLTGLFESLIVMTVVFGLIYLMVGIVMRQVWFGSVMVWVIFSIVVLAGLAAEPASEPHEAAKTPWAIAHGVAMILGGACVMLATASAFLYLLTKRKLKQKKVLQVLGKVPNLEKLENMNLFGLQAALVLITTGLLSGFGLISTVSMLTGASFVDWITDAKIVMICVAWILLAVTLLVRWLGGLKGRTTAYLTIVTFVLMLFAIVGTSVLCSSMHVFSDDGLGHVEQKEQQLNEN
jgi:ABC-type uncharacterized transport system permease subunit